MLAHYRSIRIIRTMLTDIFAYRYADVPMWDAFTERDRRFIVQSFRIIAEQLFPPTVNGKKSDWAEAKWKLIHDRLSTELGMVELSKRAYSYPYKRGQNTYYHSGTNPWNSVCEKFVYVDYEADIPADEFIKERLSFVEIAFRERGNDIAAANAGLPREILKAKARMAIKGANVRLPGSLVDGVKANNRTFNDAFEASVNELNTRFRHAGYDLNYHNGFIQIAADAKVDEQIETPFWALVADQKWQNVDTDMKEALDLRDSGGRDPSWHAAKALESTIKIISDTKHWTHGKENGPHNFIENLANKKNGRFIDAWEMDSLKQFFTDVRRPFGHGAGSDDMPKLNDQQTNWAIEFCMTWVKSLIERL